MPDLTEYSWIAWVAVILVCVIIELLTLEFTFLMIAAGSVGGLGADLLGADWWVQILVALVLAVLLILTIRPLLLRVMHRGADPTPSNVDALIGMAGRVALPLDDIGGQVRLANGETWTARLEEAPAEALPLGTVVTVRRVLGSVVLVELTGEPAPAPITGVIPAPSTGSIPTITIDPVAASGPLDPSDPADPSVPPTERSA